MAKPGGPGRIERKTVTGSSALTPEQTDWFAEKIGERYLHVQTDADVPSRKQARRQARAAAPLRRQALRRLIPMLGPSKKQLWRQLREERVQHRLEIANLLDRIADLSGKPWTLPPREPASAPAPALEDEWLEAV